MDYVFKPAQTVSISVSGRDTLFPVRRVYCVGRNYAAHAREMGKDPDREPPFFFIKPVEALVPSGSDIPYPSRTGNLHHEIELVVAIGQSGRDISIENAQSHIFGYAVGNDLTRRDLQLEAREKGRPWETGKSFEAAAPITEIVPLEDCGRIEEGSIWIKVNGDTRQSADIADLIWSVPEIIAELSTYYELQPGDLVFTGTPAGVGAVERGDLMQGAIAGLPTLTNRVV